MYIERVPNRGSPPAVLLREGWREGGKVRKRTLANLSHWPAEKVEALRRVLRGETLAAPADAFTITRSRPHGHVAAVLAAVRQLGMERLLAPRRSPERDRIVSHWPSRPAESCHKAEGPMRTAADPPRASPQPNARPRCA